MTCLNSRVSWNRMTFEANLVFIRVLNFHGGTLTSKHVLCHSCRPLPLFLVQVVIFYNMDCASLSWTQTNTYFEPSVEYWQHLDMAWPQQDLANGANNPYTSQNTTEVNTKVIVERLLPSFLTYARTQALSPCFASTSFTCKAMALLDVSTISKNPMVTWQGFHLSFKKCTMRIKVFTPPLDIQISKDTKQVL